MKIFLTVVALSTLASTALARTPATDPWQPLQFLVGEWTAEGSGEPGQGSGSFSFRFDLDRKILIRQNRSDYPATKDHPAFSHGDLMVIYPESKGGDLRAIYFDNEGHVIEYELKILPGGTVEFVGSAVPGSPRFRLTYTKTTGDALAVKFEIASPDHPNIFKTYLQGLARPAGAGRNLN